MWYWTSIFRVQPDRYCPSFWLINHFCYLLVINTFIWEGGALLYILESFDFLPSNSTSTSGRSKQLSLIDLIYRHNASCMQIGPFLQRIKSRNIILLDRAMAPPSRALTLSKSAHTSSLYLSLSSSDVVPYLHFCGYVSCLYHL